MVAYFGLDEKVGPISFYDSTGLYDRILGKPYSENMGKLIDTEVHNLITTQYKRVKEILISHKDELEKLAQLLLKKEVADKDDLEKILGKRDENKVLIKTPKMKIT
jgi:cell division protease FtsH